MTASTKNIYSAIAGITLLLAHGSVFAIPILNGSMTGQPQIGNPPPNWTSASVDGDTIPVGGLNGWGTGIGSSPDGGTFLSLLNNGGGGSFDAVMQDISGFTIGEAYTLQFSYANIGLDSSAAGNYANPGLIRANIAGTDLDSLLLNFDGFGSQQWFNYTGNFVATAATHALTFSAVRQGSGGYAGGVDGVSVTIVPEPVSMALIGLVATGIFFKRRFFVA